jgi:peptidoglycan/LPS O-acetylase OafA/YrhL
MENHPTGGQFLTTATIAISDAAVHPGQIVGFKQNIHYLRGIAAVAVMLFHTGFYYQNAYGPTRLSWIFSGILGVYGVSIFFAISGYLMAEIIRKQEPWEFLSRRVLRIYPLFIIATIATLIVRQKIWPTYDTTSIFLAPMGVTKYPLGVEWTLVYEVFFYVALFLIGLVGLTRQLPAIAILWVVTILVYTATTTRFPPNADVTIFQLPFQPANIGFALGLLVPHLRKQVVPVLGMAIFGLSVIAVYQFPSSQYVRIIAGAGSAVLIAAAVRSDVRLPRCASAMFDKLGDWSYALYLIHVPILFVVFRPFFAEYGMAMFPIGIIAALTGASVLGEIDRYLVERFRAIAIQDIVARSAGVLFVAAYLAIALLYI